MTERSLRIPLCLEISLLTYLGGCVSKLENWENFEDCTHGQCEPSTGNEGGTSSISTTSGSPPGAGGDTSAAGHTSTGGQSSSGGGSTAPTIATSADRVPSNPTSTLAVGRHFTCGIRNRNLACWGTNDTLQLGNDASWPNDSVTPLTLTLGNDPAIPANFVPVEVAAGRAHACSRSSTGMIVCWGDKDCTGTGTLPVRISLKADSAANEPAEIGAGFDHSCARLQPSGEVWCWGKNSFYQLGGTPSTGSLDAYSGEPVRVNLPWEKNGAVQLSLGMQYTCALRADSTVWCWGRNDKYQLGHTASISPARIEKVDFPSEADPIVQISAGKLVACARNRIGNVYCWGDNAFGQLSAAPAAAKSWPVPQRVDLPAPAVDVRAGWQHNCALLTDNTVWCWGGNNMSCLGFQQVETDITQQPPRYWPVQIQFANGPKILELAVGETHSCVRREDGGVHCWGGTPAERGGTELALAKPLP